MQDSVGILNVFRQALIEGNDYSTEYAPVPQKIHTIHVVLLSKSTTHHKRL
jgi:hypothetical protein